MQFFEWNSPQIKNYTVFAVASVSEADSIVRYFETEEARSASFEESPCKTHYYYFIDPGRKCIAPLPFLALAFCKPHYDSPIGKMLKSFSFKLENYSLSQVDY